MYSARDTLSGGLPHSEIPGSTIARISPGLFAACHVLHRLSVPRHPPDALTLRLSAAPNGKDHIRRSQGLHRRATQASRLPRPISSSVRQTLLRRHFVTGPHPPPAAHALSDALAGPTRSPATVPHTRFFTMINQPHARGRHTAAQGNS